MSNYYAPCFYRISFVAIPSYIELACNEWQWMITNQTRIQRVKMSVEENIETQEESYNKSKDNKNFETGSIRK